MFGEGRLGLGGPMTLHGAHSPLPGTRDVPGTELEGVSAARQASALPAEWGTTSSVASCLSSKLEDKEGKSCFGLVLPLGCLHHGSSALALLA